MSEPTRQDRWTPWFQFTFRTLLILIMVAAAYFAGLSTAQKLADKATQATRNQAAREVEKAKAEARESAHKTAEIAEALNSVLKTNFGLRFVAK